LQEIAMYPGRYYLSRFGVRRYKCLGEIDIPLTPIHVLIGENDAGKTSLLEAMAAFHASSETPLGEIFPRPWEGRELVFRGLESDSIELYGQWSPSAMGDEPCYLRSFGYEISVNFPRQGTKCEAKDTRASVENKTFPLPGDSPRMGEEIASAAAKGVEALEMAYEETCQALAQALRAVLRPVHKYALDAKIMATPAAADLTRKFKFDFDGFGLPTLLQDISGYDPDLFKRLRSEFSHYFPQFKSFRVEQELALQRGYDRPGLLAFGRANGWGIHFTTQSGEIIQAQQASSGAILFLGFLALAHLPHPPNLLLIEEPENGIYPKRLGEVIAMLKDLVNRTEGVRFPQIIMTTHSPYVLSFFEPEEVTFLSREPGKPDGPVRARPLRDAPNIMERMGKEFYLGELWYNLSEEELFGEP
jgi:predicted ATPase